MVGDTIKMSVPGVVCALLVSSAQAFQFKSITGKSGVVPDPILLSCCCSHACSHVCGTCFKLPTLFGQDVIVSSCLLNSC